METKQKRITRTRNLIFDLALVGVLLAAAALRFTGIYWDEDQHLHPDERFLTGVVASLQPVHSVSEYFDTANSTLNPNNRGSDFFVYGTLPVFIVRYAAEWVGQTGYGQVNIVGRMLSAIADLGVIFVVYLLATRLFDRRVGLLAAIISTFSVMQIQQSHFWTVDNFVNFFTVLTVYFAVRVATPQRDSEKVPFNPFDFVGLGIALGCALASKLSAPVHLLALAGTLPVGVVIRTLTLSASSRPKQLRSSIIWVLAAALLSIVVFRIFQPYAFVGLGLNPHWVDTMKQLSAQVNGDADWPPSMQWARRSFFFGFDNLVRWGLGLPLAIVCGMGMAWAGWRIYKGDWAKAQVIVWGWGLLFFAYQSTAFNPTMRYFLPVYPVLAVFGAWFVIWLWDAGARKARAAKWQRWLRPVGVLLGATAVIGGGLWAVAFVQIYRQPMARIAAARWVYENVPGPITLTIAGEHGVAHQPLAVPYNNEVDKDTVFTTAFIPRVAGQLSEVDFKYVLAPVSLSLSSGTEEEILLANVDQLVDFASLQP
ncbi:MAG TPA: glycosyltransferase family 39 protein, partial [Terriglobales bacterium]|nr:glycosyltransferase family 39 protein [Terriglobales bacterium]